MKKVVSLILALTVILSAIMAVPMSAQAKTKHKNYKSCVSYCESFEGKRLVKKDKNSECEYGCYNYLTIKTPYGKQTSLIVSLGSEYRSKTRIYVKLISNKKSSKENKSAKAVLMQTLPGSIVSFSKSRTYLLLLERLDLGYDHFRLYKYNKKDKKYVRIADSYAKQGTAFKKQVTQKQAKEQIRKKSKVDVTKFKYFKYYKHTIFAP